MLLIYDWLVNNFEKDNIIWLRNQKLAGCIKNKYLQRLEGGTNSTSKLSFMRNSTKLLVRQSFGAYFWLPLYSLPAKRERSFQPKSIILQLPIQDQIRLLNLTETIECFCTLFIIR